MGSFVFTATESLIGGYEIGDAVTLEIGVQEAVRARRVEKSVQRSDGGAIEVLKHRSEVTWTVTLEPVAGHELNMARMFLDSTEAGEQFTMDLYGDAAVPTPVKRIDDGYTEQPFIRRGSRVKDYFVMSFEVVEV